MQQHEYVAKLNQQAHLDALTKHDEYIVDCIQLHDKLSIIIQQLLVMEVWREQIFAQLLHSLSPSHTLKVYILLYHQATIANLLEVLCYHSSTLQAAGDTIIELIDYCQRKLLLFNTPRYYDHILHKDAQTSGSSITKKKKNDNDHQQEEEEKQQISIDKDVEDNNKSTRSSLYQQCIDIDYACGICCFSILRFITDHLTTLSLSCTARLLHTHDILISIIPLILESPATRRRKKLINADNNKKKSSSSSYIWEKYIDQRWIEVADNDRNLLTKTEAQLWLIVYNLLITPICRSYYQYNSYRQEMVLKIRPLLTTELLDQLPLLTAVKRYIEELVIMQAPPPTASSSTIIEQIPEIRTSIIANKDYHAIAKEQLSTIFDPNIQDSTEEELSILSDTYAYSAFSPLFSIPVCAVCGMDADKRCSLCQCVWYCCRECQVADWKQHKSICETARFEQKEREAQKAAFKHKQSQEETSSKEQVQHSMNNSDKGNKRILIEEIDS